jgi:ElaB/YqjD/DUF883 family membrane-anchored ribosome-binding protein
MANSPDKPVGSGLETDSLPWAPSPGSQHPLESATAAAEGFTDDPTSAEEAIGGGSHSTAEASAEAARNAAASPADDALAGAVTVRDALEDAILARPIEAVGIAALVGFLAAMLFRR